MDTYTLPNGQKIDIDGVVDAVLSYTEYPMHFLDTEMSNVCVVESPEALARLVEEIGASDRYREITHFDNADYTDVMEDFLDVIVRMEDEKLYRTFTRMFEEKGWQAVVAHWSADDSESWIYGWNQWVGDAAWEVAVEWMMNIPDVPVKASFEGCANCSLCVLIHDGEDADMKKLIHAFEVENTAQKIAQTMPVLNNEKNEKKSEAPEDL